MPTENVLKKKFCLVGDGGVGKTSLIRRFVLDQFDDRYITTIGTKVTKKSISFDTPQHNDRIEMILWDIVGQQGYRTSLQDAYFKGAVGVIAVCDCTRKNTLSILSPWIDGFNKVCGNVPAIILANKADLKEQMQLLPSDLNEFAEKSGAIGSYYTSAKTGANVEKCFIDIALASLAASSCAPASNGG